MAEIEQPVSTEVVDLTADVKPAEAPPSEPAEEPEATAEESEAPAGEPEAPAEEPEAPAEEPATTGIYNIELTYYKPLC
eukprot:CAMPEP_0204876288 /NCGR_PEP_ID=MMETSP1348-20121228/47555_1 /ASSEMBLY_ACC=CAM_ASM_000700 /TAXON_ID=215587 /ORGANISM="Aplanochytrium stocchinoi, Strain GSBS06" /LENGTH=78 /DNA_ID=CAMNT_0052033027 /DNA_START=51 /DNA_END=287 /DNA_ORIENTATION=-